MVRDRIAHALAIMAFCYALVVGLGVVNALVVVALLGAAAAIAGR